MNNTRYYLKGGTIAGGYCMPGLAFWPRPKIFGQFGRPKWLNGQNSQFSAKFWPNNTHNIVLILIRNGLAFGRGQRFFWPICPANPDQRPNTNSALKYDSASFYVLNNSTNSRISFFLCNNFRAKFKHFGQIKQAKEA